MKSILAIDPGAIGGIAFLHHHIDGAAVADPMPDTDADIVRHIEDCVVCGQREGAAVVAYVERVGGFIGKRQPGSAMFKFGFGCGVIEGALRALGIRTIYVRPQEWQKHFGLGSASGCASKTEWKNKLKAEAQRRFPQLKVTLATADALLLLEYARAKEVS